jgi:hypothetical protein
MKLPQAVVDIIIAIAWKAVVWAITNVGGVKEGLLARLKALADANHLSGLYVVLLPEFERLLTALAAEAKAAIGGDAK